MAESGSQTEYNGLLLVDKELHMTSHDVAQRVRRIFGQKSVGHTGTLDPLASGLMVICLGKATKLSRFLELDHKTYEATVRLGKRSTTLDSEGVYDSDADTDDPGVSEDVIRETLEKFVGEIKQQVPIYSAVKVSGKRLYKSARAGEEVETPIRTVRIDKIEVVGYDTPNLRLIVDCGSGTYIRSLASDIGDSLGCGAYLSELRRTAVGGFNIENAKTLADLEGLDTPAKLSETLMSAEGALTLPKITIVPEFEPRVRNGVRPRAENISEEFAVGDHVSLINEQGRTLAVAVAEAASSSMRDQSERDCCRYLRVL
jgi:tRNA pseudouridine55 synthase